MDVASTLGGTAFGLALGAALARQCGAAGRRAAKTPCHPAFPPEDVRHAEDWAWFDRAAPGFEPMQDATPRERELCAMSATEYTAARKAGRVSCAEYCAALVRRLHHFEASNAFMATSLKMTHLAIAQAETLDAKAASEGVDSIAPLYGLPVPIKGTAATVTFPSSVGCGVLDSFHAKKDCELVERIVSAGGVVFCKTNVPEFAASWVTLNRTNGTTWNPYPCKRGALTTGGSSGGAACAVATHVAPIAMTEDTGGSTRHPANQCGNFGYDPPRNKWPNEGNPGITYFNDQVGINTRSFADVLLFDIAINGAADEHAAAASKVAAMDSSAIRIGFPQEIFVDQTTTPSCIGWDRHRASDSIVARLEACAHVLGKAGFAIIREEWPKVASARFGSTPVNALRHWIEGLEYAPGKYAEGNMIGLGSHSFTGQIATFLADYYDGCNVSINNIREDVTPVGSHNPSALMQSFTDESMFRFLGQHQRIGVEIWNSYFDEHSVDIILTPSQYQDSGTYRDWVSGRTPIKVKAEDGGFVDGFGNNEECNAVHYCWFKHIPVPKLTIPLGLDFEGRPVSVTAWGRAVPAEHLYDDVYARTHDLEWLYKVGAVVEALHANGGGLQRVEPPCNADLRPQ